MLDFFLIISMIGKDTRLIIVDLDNTLWGGVIGEDGIEGVKIGGDFPGNAFKAFQIELLNQSKRGIAIAIASKNNEDLALEAISKLPEMIYVRMMFKHTKSTGTPNGKI